jgi:toxin-antitoxin system PIN domain toxin
MTSSVFPDINVWIALVFDQHRHHEDAVRWYNALDPFTIFAFCRHTQLGLFRLLSTDTVMGQNALSLRDCWQVYDEWIDTGQAVLLPEPAAMEDELRRRTSQAMVAPKLWADAYLAAFAEAAELTLVTFDRVLAGKVKGAVLLG